MYESKNPTGRCYVNFPDKGVEIFIPPQGKNIKVEARMISKTKWDKIQLKPGDYTPQRGVINFQVFDENDIVVKTFKPPIELKVFFTQEDKDQPDKNKPVVLGYLVEKEEEEKERWILFDVEEHQLRQHYVEDSDSLAVNSWTGYFTVEINKWGDPSVSVGK